MRSTFHKDLSCCADHPSGPPSACASPLQTTVPASPLDDSDGLDVFDVFDVSDESGVLYVSDVSDASDVIDVSDVFATCRASPPPSKVMAKV